MPLDRQRPSSCAKCFFEQICQAPEEFQASVATSAIMVAAAITLPMVEALMMNTAGDDINDARGETDNVNTVTMFRRRTALLILTALAGAGIFVSPLLGPLWRFAFQGEELKGRCVLRRCCHGVALRFSRESAAKRNCQNDISPMPPTPQNYCRIVSHHVACIVHLVYSWRNVNKHKHFNYVAQAFGSHGLGEDSGAASSRGLSSLSAFCLWNRLLLLFPALAAYSTSGLTQGVFFVGTSCTSHARRFHNSCESYTCNTLENKRRRKQQNAHTIMPCGQ